MLVMNAGGEGKLLSSTFTLGAEGSAPVGRTATAQADAQMKAEILSFALEGATLREDLDDNAALYGKKFEDGAIVTEGIGAPRAASRLLGMLNRYSARVPKSISQLN
jgi:lipid-binding SYLF domain-containing protein